MSKESFPSKDSDEEKHRERQESGHRVLNDFGHIDFSSRPALIAMGVNEDTTPMSPEQYLDMYRKTYNKVSNLEPTVILAVAESTFGAGKEYANPGLLQGIRQLLAPAQGQTSDALSSSGDPLAGTEYAELKDEELYHGQTLRKKDGELVNPGTPGYREAFLYALETQANQKP